MFQYFDGTVQRLVGFQKFGFDKPRLVRHFVATLGYLPVQCFALFCA